jgi:signal transduction histidine kinase
MAERAEQLGGALELGNGPTRGAVLVWRAPVPLP